MKKILSVLLTIAVILTISGCGAKQEVPVTEKKIIKVGASPVPHKEILEIVKLILAKDGYTLEITEFTDYVTPNTALAEGQIDANFFQHAPYLESFSKERGLDLDYTVKVHIEPMGLYSSKYKSLNDLKDGAEIAIPSDATNGARALRVLENAGLLKLKSGELISKLDITENPKKLKITELDAPQLPRILKDVDAAVINSNFAIEADLNPTEDSLAMESKDSPYANVLAVRSEDKTKPYIEAFSKALTCPEVKKFIEDKYKGNIISAF
ncbi:MetQ/NlpA family ABC transporter substrate-binding protein [Clostridium sp.]|uniref:MetQ/NlpA family ABC transporter substrate-binding protein n=1 Tax=Clostridium sp. TaxID=1506 RepID=UPI003D6D82B2